VTRALELRYLRKSFGRTVAVGADDQEADISGDERSQQIDKVLVHRGGRRAVATVPR
jgi:hypothetical protein